MREYQLSLPEDVYQGLLATASTEGITPTSWIALHLPVNPQQNTVNASEPDDVSDIIGAINSRQHGHSIPPPTALDDILMDKMREQGLIFP